MPLFATRAEIENVYVRLFRRFRAPPGFSIGAVQVVTAAAAAVSCCCYMPLFARHDGDSAICLMLLAAGRHIRCCAILYHAMLMMRLMATPSLC